MLSEVVIKTPSLKWVEAFNFKTQTWESVSSLYEMDLHEQTIVSVVMNDKIYGCGQHTRFVYDPKEGTFEENLSLKPPWMKGSCVIDNMLYSFFRAENRVVVYDPVVRIWRFLLGFVKLPEALEGCTMVNHGGRLVILFVDRRKCPTEIWCTETALERGEGMFINGRFLSSNHVLTLTDSFIIERALAVTV